MAEKTVDKKWGWGKRWGEMTLHSRISSIPAQSATHEAQAGAVMAPP